MIVYWFYLFYQLHTDKYNACVAAFEGRPRRTRQRNASDNSVPPSPAGSEDASSPLSGLGGGRRRARRLQLSIEDSMARGGMSPEKLKILYLR